MVTGWLPASPINIGQSRQRQAGHVFSMGRNLSVVLWVVPSLAVGVR